MMLHIPTLLMVSVFIFCLMGLLTLHAWSRETRERCLGYLGSTLLLASLGLLFNSLRGIGPEWVPLLLGNVLLLLSASLNWTAMRVFAGRSPSLPGILAGPLLWLLLCLMPTFYAELGLRVLVYSLLVVAYGLLTGLELWRKRQQLEVAYLPALILTLMHTLFYSARIFLDQGLGLDNPHAASGEGIAFFPILLFEAILYVIGIGYVTLAMVKERAELRFKAAAYKDPLTGIGNRRAFMHHGAQTLAECERRGVPAALLLCDLDHFKRLNDTFGHAMGDQALVAFSQVANGNLRSADVLGRIGGEEFACVLVGVDDAQAMVVAERIRHGFTVVTLLEPGLLSVSIGVVTSADCGYQLSRLLSVADEALYGAKHNGRNQVQRVAISA